MMRIVLSVAVAALVGCGGESSDRATTSAPVRQPPRALAKQRVTNANRVEKAEPMDQEELSSMLHSYWVWPEDGDPERDLEADHSACVGQIDADPADPRRIKRLASLAHQIQCLQEKGWVQREP